MKFLKLKPKIFKKFPSRRGGRIFFAVGGFNFDLLSPQKVLLERRKLLKNLGIKSNKLVLLEQSHSDRIVFVTRKSRIDFLAQKSQRGDGLVTNLPDIFLAIRSADCLPILFYNKAAGIIGAVHAGWKGTAERIIQKAVREVQRKFNAPLSDFYFFFGPAAQACCYEIYPLSISPSGRGRKEGLERASFFPKEVIRERRGKIYLDFVKANYLQLLELGIKPSQIENSGICTIHNLKYPSHRREGTNRQNTLLSLIGLK